MNTITIAVKEKTDGRKLVYVLKQDEKGYFFDGMECVSFRRKTRKAIEARAIRHHFDIIDTEVK